jgi:hypothetical protein
MGMRSRGVYHLLLFSFLLVFTSAIGAGEQERGAPTPEEAAKRVYTALRVGKVTDALPYIAEPERRFWTKYLQAAKAAEEYLAVMEDKFGKDPESRQKLDLLRQVKADFPIEIQEAKEDGKHTVHLIIWERRTSPGILERKLDAVKTEAGWKLRYPGSPSLAKAEDRKAPDGKKFVVWVESEPEKEHAKKNAELDFILLELPKEAQAVKAGKYKSRQEAFDAVQKRAQEKIPQ